MPPIALYLDEHIQIAFGDALRSRGIDILTTQEAHNTGLEDTQQLAFATDENRVLLSYNRRHFAQIHHQWMRIRRPHAGIVISDQIPIGIVLRRLMKLYFSLCSEEMANRLEYLSNWK
ncbi:MAG: hypothetical protein A2169_01235 [Deltaproteobacteria bacterium RBG_13_47_9]|nr:MAG: hypothetical protein A2169_01235 [Deltaproteobacteria bacterium RBG_13_47_9]